METHFVPIVSFSKHLFHFKNVIQSGILQTDSVSRPKTVIKTAKTAKIHFCRQKFSNFSMHMDQFFPFGLIFFFLEKSSDSFESNILDEKRGKSLVPLTAAWETKV
jgi:adenylate cyclase